MDALNKLKACCNNVKEKKKKRTYTVGEISVGIGDERLGIERRGHHLSLFSILVPN